MNLSHARGATAHVQIAPLTQGDGAELSALADAHPEVFRHWPRSVAAGYWGEVDWLLGEQQEGRWLAHVVRDPQGRIVGQTCYLNLRALHAGVEIGGTWYAPYAQGRAINPAAKLVLLDHAFACGAERVELKTDAENAPSRAAIAKLGATFEGIFRRHMRRPDGTWRDTAWFSIIAPDWPILRARLVDRLAGFGP